MSFPRFQPLLNRVDTESVTSKRGTSTNPETGPCSSASILNREEDKAAAAETQLIRDSSPVSQQLATPTGEKISIHLSRLVPPSNERFYRPSSFRNISMGQTSKDLLSLEREKSSTCPDSILHVCKKDSVSKTPKPSQTNEKLATTTIPLSEVLGKVKTFLGDMEEANKRLQFDAQKKSCDDYDIEVLTGNETEYIEMDLLLGVADLHTSEAVAAAESAMAGLQPACTLGTGSNGSYSKSSDDDSDSDDDDDKTCSPDKNRKVDPDNSLDNDQPKKRPKITELQ
ncbi:hypothetical protein NE237_030261 [Protea cynaroides]|uniref:Uncharacterized protein n=1 Tax=Protea cynaroides TaxID=273540 RepID=A0A9Q0GTQ7_9MAGN|nr:hypothetical protein NE237_030261 [Protea cynaroides]